MLKSLVAPLVSTPASEILPLIFRKLVALKQPYLHYSTAATYAIAHARHGAVIRNWEARAA
jgi:hypothetical protein